MARTLEELLNADDDLKKLDKSSVFRAVETSPEEAGEAQRLAPAVQLPPPVIREQLPEMRKEAQRRSLSQLMATSPELGDLRHDEEFLSVVQDKQPEISKTSQILTNLLASVNKLTGGAVATAGVVLEKAWAATPLGAMEEMYSQQLEQHKKDHPLDAQKVDEELARLNNARDSNMGRVVARAGVGIMESADIDLKPLAPWEDVKRAQGFVDTTVAGGGFILEQTVYSAPEMAAAYFAPWLIAGSYTGQVGAARAARRGEEVSFQDVAEAAPAGVVISLLNKYGADRVLGSVAALNSSALRRVATAAAAEGVTEVAQEEIQYVAERYGIDPLDLKEMIALIPPTLLGAAGAGGAIRGLVEVGTKVSDGVLKQRAKDANEHAKLLGQLNSVVEASKLAERSPDQLTRMVEQLAPGIDLFVDSDTAEKLMQSDLELSPDIEARIAEAVEAGTPVRFTAAEYATYLTPVATTLNEKIRVGAADAMTVEEGMAIEVEFAARAEQMQVASVAVEKVMTEGEQIRQQVQAQIVSSGRFRNDVADAYSALVRDFYMVNAARTGVSPAEMWARYPLRVQSITPEGESLGQGEPPSGYTRRDFLRMGAQAVAAVSTDGGVASQVLKIVDSGNPESAPTFEPFDLDEYYAKGAADRIGSSAAAWRAARPSLPVWSHAEMYTPGGSVRPEWAAVVSQYEAALGLAQAAETAQTELVAGQRVAGVLDTRALAPVATLAAGAQSAPVPLGYTRFRHFGNFDVPSLDPSYQGSGARGAERKRSGGPKVLSLYPDHVTAESREAGTGNIEYFVDIPSDSLYDVQADPQGLRAQAKEVARATGVDEFSYYEGMIEKAGYVGYVVKEGSMAGQGRIFRAIPVVGGTRSLGRQTAFDPNSIPRAQHLPPGQREIETKFANWLAEDFDRAVAEYNAHPESKGGRILNTDIARDLSPEYKANRSLSAAVHEPASWFINQLYERRLVEAPPGKVLFTAGGTGAGKSSALRDMDRKYLEQFPIIFDTNIAKASSGQKKIDQALATGRKVEVAYVYGDPRESLARAVRRTKNQRKRDGSGRTVPLWAHIAAHIGSRRAVPQLNEHYGKNNPNVLFLYLVNEDGKPARVADVAELPILEYNSVRSEVNAELEVQKGNLTAEELAAYRAEGTQPEPASFPEGSGEELGSSGSGSGSGGGQEVDPMRGNYLNIGLEIGSGSGQFNTPELVRDALAGIGVGVEQLTVHPSGTEPTAAIKTDRPLTPDEANALAVALGQQAIVQVTNGEGSLHGPQAAAWGDFNPDAFLTLDGRPLSQVLAQGGRGQITLGQDMQANPSIVTLLEKADLSTFLHESGHFFLEVLTDLAARPNAPAEIVADVQTLFSWMGFKGTAAEWRATPLNDRRDAHEQFARGFEAYLLEGKAPNTEMRQLFHRFRSWLLNIYKSVSRLNVNLTDEVRQVMDRMIASREQVASAEAARMMLPLFKDAAAAGMDEAQWTQYQQMAQDATNNAQDQLQARSLRNVRWLANARAKELSKEQAKNKAKRDAVRSEVEDLVAQRPERVAETLLLTGEAWIKGDDGQPRKIELPKPHKLSTTRLAALYGTTDDYRQVAADAGMVDPNAVRAPWHSLPRNLVAKEGLDPEVVAELTGFTSGDELVQALIKLPPREQLVENVTDQLTLRRYGDLTDAVSVERAVDIALHNQMRTRMVATELAALEGAQQVNGRRDALRRAAREFAERVVQRKKIRDLRPSQFAAGETRAAKLAMEALGEGNMKQAAAYKRDQLFNGYASRAASRAQDAVEVGLRYLNKFNETSTRKNLDPSYRDQIDKLLERYSLRPASLREIDKRASLAAWIEEQRKQGHEPALPDELVDEAGRTHYRNMSFENFEGLVDAVKNIEHLARLKAKLLANKRQRDFDKAIAELTAGITANAPKAKPVELERDVSLLGRAGEFFRDWFTSLRKLSSITRVMDGVKDGGMAWEYFVRPLNDAADNEVKMRSEATKKLNKLFDMVPDLNPNAVKRGIRNVAGNTKLFIPAINKSLSLHARIAVALNAGNEGNLQRLREGNRWTDAQISAIIGTLSKEEMNFVQGVFDLIDSYWSQIKAKEERVSGIAPGKVEPTPIRTPHGEYRGGYYPIVADPMRSDKVVQQNDAELISQSLRGAVSRATTRRGHTKERVGGTDPIRLDLGVIVQHIAQVTHDLAWHETLIDYNKVLRNSQVQGLIRDHYGPETTAFMRRVADDVARGEVGPRTATERMLNHMRVGSTVVGLGLSATTALLQITGVTQSIVRAGSMNVARGYGLWVSHPVQTTKLVYEKSTFMRQRDVARNRELGDIFNRIDGQKHPLAKVYFWPIQALQKGVDIPTWLGVYNDAITKGEADERAVALADQAVTDAQASGRTHDLSEVQRGGPLLKLLTNFYSYFSSTYQLSVESAKRVKNEKSLGSVLNLATDYMLLFAIPVILGTLIREGLKGDMPDDPEELAAHLAAAQVSYVLGMFPVVREVSGALQGFSYQGPAGLSMLSDFSKLATQAAQGEADEAFWRSLNRVGGTLLHYPAGQLDRSVRGAIAVAEGDAPPQAVLLGPPRE